MKIFAITGFFSAGLLLSGCLVGPNYKGPPDVAKRTLAQGHFERMSADVGGGVPPPSRWWDAIDDPLLTRMIDDALAASPRLRVAQARLRSARAQLQSSRAMLLPTGGANAAYTRARISTDGLVSGGGSATETSAAIPDPLKLGLYSAGFDASWELDLFGASGAASKARVRPCKPEVRRFKTHRSNWQATLAKPTCNCGRHRFGATFWYNPWRSVNRTSSWRSSGDNWGRAPRATCNYCGSNSPNRASN